MGRVAAIFAGVVLSLGALATVVGNACHVLPRMGACPAKVAVSLPACGSIEGQPGCPGPGGQIVHSSQEADLHAAAHGSADAGWTAADHAPGGHALRVAPADGRIDVDQLTHGFAEVVGLPRPPVTGWTVDLMPLLRTLGVFELGAVTDGLLSAQVKEDGVSIVLDDSVLRRHWDGLVGTLATWWESGARQAAMLPAWSLTFLNGEPSGHDATSEMPERVVVLVAGLDDPGWIWDSLLPALRERGVSAARFDYANDGPIAQSADDLGAALELLRRSGVERVDLVAHSMGGLLARDVLTRPAWYDGDACGGGRLPAVDRVIMVGTPNYGARTAQLRFASEVKEHAVRWARGEGRLDGPLRDGRGEAAVDLAPGSDFLAELNSRPLPLGCEITVIAGELVARDAIASPLGGALPDCVAVKLADSLSERLGDGLVTGRSACLDGIADVVVVRGNHHSILRSWWPGSVPPAVPVIMDRLCCEEQGTR